MISGKKNRDTKGSRFPDSFFFLILLTLQFYKILLHSRILLQQLLYFRFHRCVSGIQHLPLSTSQWWTSTGLKSMTRNTSTISTSTGTLQCRRTPRPRESSSGIGCTTTTQPKRQAPPPIQHQLTSDKVQYCDKWIYKFRDCYCQCDLLLITECLIMKPTF